MMDQSIGPVILGCISAAFAVYGLSELWRAYFIRPVSQWCERAVPGAAGIAAAGLFAELVFRSIG